MVKIHRREIQRRGRQMLAFLLAAAMIIGLIPRNIHVSAASKATEDTYESGDCVITYKENSAWVH